MVSGHHLRTGGWFMLLFLVVASVVSAEPVKLTWTFWYGDPVWMEKDLRILSGFQEEYPNIEVEPVGMAITSIDDYYEAITLRAAAGELPDVFWVQPSMLGALVENQLLLDITAMAEKDEKWQDTVSSLLPQAQSVPRYNNRQYGFPRDFGVVFLAYNKHAFETSGLPYPNELRSQGDWTWDMFEDVGKKVTVPGADGRPQRFTIAGYDWWSAVRQAGGGVFGDDGKRLRIAEPESRRGLEWLQDLTQASLLPQAGEPANWFAQQSVMTMAGVWVFGAFDANADFEWDIVEMPAGPAGAINASDEGLGLLNGVSSQTKHPEEAYLLARYFAERRAQSIQVEEGNAFPIYRDLALEFVNGPAMPAHAYEIPDYYANTVFTDKPPQFNDIKRILDKYVPQVIANQITAQEGVEQIMTEASAMLSD